jgi:hypothetical protein
VIGNRGNGMNFMNYSIYICIPYALSVSRCTVTLSYERARSQIITTIYIIKQHFDFRFCECETIASIACVPLT